MIEDKNQEDLQLYPLLLLKFVTIFCFAGAVLHGCTAIYITREFNMDKPIYQLMLGATIFKTCGLLSESILAINLSIDIRSVMLFQNSIVITEFIVQLWVFSMAFLRFHSVLTDKPHNLEQFQKTFIKVLVPITLSYVMATITMMWTKSPDSGGVLGFGGTLHIPVSTIVQCTVLNLSLIHI